ncbi:CPBP family intramembrane glutamic endopeptidase [Leptospira idonii]|uniref:CPBP family intramembrane metalloprotease n=1 Tax=Leptospira idonii TaxID=1193500 RepID=A0A4V3JXJ1_9LEPT|nr:CPBP family intramembrane glutamic endopeptidase [Leptospira idonii]TGN17058.1 CPBP family intramembrane metalloprotease [Leptospira idonii]
MQTRFYEIFKLTAFALLLILISTGLFTIIYLGFMQNNVFSDRIPEAETQPILEEFIAGKIGFQETLDRYNAILNPLREEFSKEMGENPGKLEVLFYDKMFSDKPHYTLVHSVSWFLCYIVVGYFFYKKILQIPITDLQEELSLKVILKGIGNGFALFLAVLLISNILLALGVKMEPGIFSEKLSASLAGGNGYLLAWGIYTIGMITGIMEEVFFRGFLLKSFIDKNLEQEGLMIISLIFGWLHFGSGTTVAVPFLLTFVGMYFGFLYLKTKNLWISVACHASYNIFGLLAAYMKMDGVTP